MENKTQKINKISLSSSSPSDYQSEDSIEYERTPNLSLNPTQESISELMSIIILTLSQRGIQLEGKEVNFEGLKAATTVLCTEFLKIPQPDISKLQSLSIEPGFELQYGGLHSDSRVKIIDKLFFPRDSEVVFSQSECKTLSGLVVELLRESTESKINSKIQELQMTIVNNAKVINNLRQEAKEKDKLLNDMKKDLETQNLPKIFKPIKKTKYNESQSTLNESEDAYL